MAAACRSRRPSTTGQYVVMAYVGMAYVVMTATCRSCLLLHDGPVCVRSRHAGVSVQHQTQFARVVIAWTGAVALAGGAAIYLLESNVRRFRYSFASVCFDVTRFVRRPTEKLAVSRLLRRAARSAGTMDLGSVRPP